MTSIDVVWSIFGRFLMTNKSMTWKTMGNFMSAPDTMPAELLSPEKKPGLEWSLMRIAYDSESPPLYSPTEKKRLPTKYYISHIYHFGSNNIYMIISSKVGVADSEWAPGLNWAAQMTIYAKIYHN